MPVPVARVVRAGERWRSTTSATEPGAVDPSAELGLAAARAGDRGPARARAAVSRARWPWPGCRSTPHARETLDAALPASFAEQAALALQVARAREDQERLAVFEDRDRIGRDLHDLVIQRLFAVGLGLQSAARRPPTRRSTARLEQAVDDLDATIKDIRRTIFALGSLTTRRTSRPR